MATIDNPRRNYLTYVKDTSSWKTSSASLGSYGVCATWNEFTDADGSKKYFTGPWYVRYEVTTKCVEMCDFTIKLTGSDTAKTIMSQYPLRMYVIKEAIGSGSIPVDSGALVSSKPTDFSLSGKYSFITDSDIALTNLDEEGYIWSSNQRVVFPKGKSYLYLWSEGVYSAKTDGVPVIDAVSLSTVKVGEANADGSTAWKLYDAYIFNPDAVGSSGNNLPDSSPLLVTVTDYSGVAKSTTAIVEKEIVIPRSLGTGYAVLARSTAIYLKLEWSCLYNGKTNRSTVNFKWYFYIDSTYLVNYARSPDFKMIIKNNSNSKEYVYEYEAYATGADVAKNTMSTKVLSNDDTKKLIPFTGTNAEFSLDLENTSSGLLDLTISFSKNKQTQPRCYRVGRTDSENYQVLDPSIKVGESSNNIKVTGTPGQYDFNTEYETIVTDSTAPDNHLSRNKKNGRKWSRCEIYISDGSKWNKVT